MRKRKCKRIRPLIIVLIVFILIGFGLFGLYRYLLEEYRISEVYVEGNVHHTDEEIKALVMEGKYGDNSLFLSRKYRDREIKDVPFVETISVNVLDKHIIRISVYEKALAGYVEFLGRNVYFDKDGIVVEVSNEKTPGVPRVVGIDFDYVILHEKLPVSDEELFSRVLNITKLMDKYGVNAGEIYFSGFGEITLFKDDITIKLGKDKDIDIKIMNLPPMLEKLEGSKGTLKMENYDESTKRVSFEKED